MHKPYTHSARKVGIAVAGAALVLSAAACGNMPTAPDQQPGMSVSAEAADFLNVRPLRPGHQACAQTDAPPQCAVKFLP